MGFLERRAEQHRQPSRPGDRYRTRQGSNEPLFGAARRANPHPVGLPPATPPDAPATPPQAPASPAPVSGPPVVPARTDPSVLLGRTVLEARVQDILREYGLVPPAGTGPSRVYLARESGVELAADLHGMITTVFLHFHGDDDFAPYTGEIPGGAGRVPRRAGLWASLGHPGGSGDPYRDRYLGDYGPWDKWALDGFHLHAQYADDGETLTRATLTLG
ncbi:hypothetical protein [Pseudosporangium ferrugineum]|uniref:Uncharacterized protein n=1 Tax=Pseudosporangium ferrugineum TaxID=439699 RepID=A0A2T0RWT6_9ACTN|nr:hypothetical protein [Pseudosporangium ferrugineum]PRY25656.1 hypothetical protein CLV70_11222 [Pseudosporangium ferrugineum]